MKHKGFTLIELLVVIAVIGILAAIILPNLRDSRTKAKDAAIVTEMNQVTTGIEIETNASGDYTDVCDLFDVGGDLEYIKESIEDHGGIWESCDSDVESYAILVTLNSQQVYNPFGIQQAYARGQVTLCHAPGTPEQETMYTEGGLTEEHLGHGDPYGECEPLGSGGGFSGIHSNDETLLSDSDIKELRAEAKSGGFTFIEPKYYCVGTAPSDTTDNGFRKGYLYTIPTGGCGSPALSFSAAQDAYDNRE